MARTRVASIKTYRYLRLGMLVTVAALTAAIVGASSITDTISMVLLIWLGLLALAFFAWWAGRHRLELCESDGVGTETRQVSSN